MLNTLTTHGTVIVVDDGGARYLSITDMLAICSITDGPTVELCLSAPPADAIRWLGNCVLGKTVAYFYRLICGILRCPNETVEYSDFFVNSFCSDAHLIPRPIVNEPSVRLNPSIGTLRSFSLVDRPASASSPGSVFRCLEAYLDDLALSQKNTNLDRPLLVDIHGRLRCIWVHR